MFPFVLVAAALFVVLILREIIRDVATNATLETGSDLTGKLDGGTAEQFKVPVNAKRLAAIEWSCALDIGTTAVSQAVNMSVRLSGEGIPGGPYDFMLGGAGVTGFGTSTGAVTSQIRGRKEVDFPVVGGALIQGLLFQVGDVATGGQNQVALVFEE